MIKLKKEEQKLDYNNLNEVISLSNRILKILFICIILGIIFVTIALFKEIKIFSFLWTIVKVSAPFFIGLIIAWLLDPLVTFLQKRKVKRPIGAIFVFFIFIIVLYVFFRIMIPMLYSQLNDFVSTLPSLFSSIGTWISELFNKFEVAGVDLTGIETNVYKSIENLSSSLTTSLPTTAINIISSLVSGIGTFLIGLIVGFYLLIDFDRVRNIFSFIPEKYRINSANMLLKLNSTLKNFFQGTVIIMIIISIISSIGYSIVKLPTPILFGVICAITNVIPYIGPWIGGALCVIVGFTVSPTVGILAALVAFIIQQIDAIFLQPIIMGKTMKLHPVTIMIGLLIFGYFFGILGMILATPVLSCCKIIIKYYLDKYEIIDKMKKNAGIKE